MGIGCSYHPYECSHDRYCEHCTWAVTEWHPDPKNCVLCQSMGFQMCEEPFAVEIRVKDYSHRKLKIFIKQARLQPQQELPF